MYQSSLDFHAKLNFSLLWGITKLCNHLHPAPSTSTQLHLLPLSSFQPPPSSLQHPQQYLNENIARNWAISPNLGHKIKSCPFWQKKWHSWYIESVDSESRLRFLKFRPRNPFLGKFGPKNSKLFVLPENWYTWYLKDADSCSISFLNFKF